MRLVLLVCVLAGAAFGADDGWWMTEPVRWVQTNLRETDARLDPDRLIGQMTDFRANVLHFSMGGIVAFYPTQVPFHYPSAYLPPGRDLMGDIVRLAHARGIRVVGRFDLSKTRKEVFDAHPEWFFRKADGSPVIYNGLYSTCINGGYYRGHALKILAEALERYDVDGLFFNMFGNQSRDYSGNFVGHCHCDACKRRYRELYNSDLPNEPDERYRQFLFRCSREVAEEIGQLIHAKRPKAGYFNYIQEYTDGIMSESNTALSRPLPLWPYTSSDNVNRARNSEPGKMAVNLNMQFFDYAWRFATVSPAEIALRLWQNISHGGAMAFAVNGTFDHEDRQAIEAARPVFRWAAEHEEFYSKQTSSARVLLLGGSARTGRSYSQAAYRGLFRLLTEEHIPFAVADNTEWIGKREFDLVVTADYAPAELSRYVESGGRVLVVSPRAPEFAGVPRVVRVHKDVEGYFRVRDHAAFPSLNLTNLVMTDGEFAETEAAPGSALTLVPPSMIGPPEKIHVDMKDTELPGIVRWNGGRAVWLPWDAGAMYYRHSLPGHAGVLRDAVASLLPDRQLKTDAHPLLEISLMRQGSRTLVHLINISGHADTAYFRPVPMRDVSIDLAGTYRKARAVRSGREIPLRVTGGRVAFRVPEVVDYELVVLE